jgi:large subunit ribosomal protein L9
VAKTVKLLLTENVDNLGIVGDVVNVRVGYARNFLLPRDLATEPSDELLAQLAEKRKQAEKQLAELRAHRESLIQKIDGLELTLTRSCNDQGHLYGSVTQQDIAEALTELGYEVKPREVRLPGTIKRVDTFEILIKFDSDLEANIKLWVVADRSLDDEREEMDFDEEGNLIEAAKPVSKDLKDAAEPRPAANPVPAAGEG